QARAIKQVDAASGRAEPKEGDVPAADHRPSAEPGRNTAETREGSRSVGDGSTLVGHRLERSTIEDVDALAGPARCRERHIVPTDHREGEVGEVLRPARDGRVLIGDLHEARAIEEIDARRLAEERRLEARTPERHVGAAEREGASGKTPKRSSSARNRSVLVDDGAEIE